MDENKKWEDKNIIKKLNKYINGFFGLGDLNYIAPFRRLIHMMLYRIWHSEKRLDEIEDSPTIAEFEDLEERVTTNEGNIENLDEVKADKEDLEAVEERVEDLEEWEEKVNDEIGDIVDDAEKLAERVTTNEENIQDLYDTKVDKTTLEEYEEVTDDRLNILEDCCTDVGEHLETIDGRLDTDEDNIDTLLQNMIVLTDHNGIIATDNYFNDYLDINMDALVKEMAENGIMKYEIYTSYYSDRDNWVSEIHDAVKDIYGYEWENNFAFIEIDNILFGGTSPRVMVKLIPRERDVYICMCYTVGNISEAFTGHCFMHRTELQEIWDKIEELDTRLENAEITIEEHTEQIEKLIEDMDHTGERLTAIEGRLDTDESNIADNTSRIETLEECCEEVGDHLDTVDKRLDTDESNITENTSRIETLEECCEEVGNHLDTIDGRLDTDETNIQSNADDISKLKEDMDHTGERLDGINATIEVIQTAIQDLRDADEVFNTRISTLEECCTDVQAAIIEIDKKADEAIETANDAMEKFDIAQSEIEHLEDDMSDVKKHSDEAIEASKEAVETANEAKAEADAAAERAEEAADKVDQFDERITTNTENIEELQNCCEEVQDTITEVKQTADEAKQEADDVSGRVEAIEEGYVKDVTIKHTYSGHDQYAEIAVTDKDGAKTYNNVGAVSSVTLTSEEDNDGQTVYTIGFHYKAETTGGAGTSVTVGTITIPAGFDPSEIEAQLQELVDEVNENKQSIEDLKTEVEELQNQIDNVQKMLDDNNYMYNPTVTHSEYNYNNVPVDEAYLWFYKNGKQNYYVSGSLAGLAFDSVENTDGSTTITVLGNVVYTYNDFIGHTTTKTYGTIEIPAGFDPTDIENQINELIEQVENNEKTIEELESDISSIQTNITNINTSIKNLENDVNDLQSDIESIDESYVEEVAIGESFGTDLEMSTRRDSMLIYYINNKAVQNGYVGQMSGLKYDKDENTDGSTVYTITPTFSTGINTVENTGVPLEIEVPPAGGGTATKVKATEITDSSDFINADFAVYTGTNLFGYVDSLGQLNYNTSTNTFSYTGIGECNIESIADHMILYNTHTSDSSVTYKLFKGSAWYNPNDTLVDIVLCTSNGTTWYIDIADGANFQAGYTGTLHIKLGFNFNKTVMGGISSYFKFYKYMEIEDD